MSATAPDGGALNSAPPFSGGALNSLRRLLGPAELLVIDLHGTLRNCAAPLRARYIGTGTNFRFLCDLLFATTATEESSVRSAADALRAMVRPAGTEVVITDLPPLWKAASALTADIRFPAWVRQDLQLGGQGRVLPRSVEREARRHGRRGELVVDFASCSAQMDRFYHEFYRPYLRARFGAQAVIVDEATFHARAAGKMLVRAFAGGEWTAGMLLEQRRTVMRFGWFGARRYPAPRGTSEVLDVACIRRAAALGIRRVVMGNSRPSLSDGVLRYKARFGASIRATRFPQDLLGISIRKPSPALIERVDQERLIAFRAGRPCLHRVDFHAGEARIALVPL